MQYTPLNNDLDYLNGSFYGNTLSSNLQKSRYNPTGENKTIFPVQWSISNEENLPVLVLCTEDGYDGEPVGSLQDSEVRDFFAGNPDCVYPPLCDLVRAGFFFHLNISQTLLLCLKRKRELLLNGANQKQTDGSASRDDACSDKNREFNEFEVYSPDIETIFGFISELLRSIELNLSMTHNPEVQKELDRITGLQYRDFDERTFAILAKEILLNRLFNYPVNSTEMAAFIKSENDELSLLRQTTQHEKQLFLMYKSTWVDLELEFFRIKEEEEQAYIRNEDMLEMFLLVFGKEHMGLHEVLMGIKTMERRIKLKTEEPSLTKEDVSKRLEREENDDLLRTENIKNIAATSLRKKGENADSVDVKMKEVSDLIKHISFFISPERLTINPLFGSLGREPRAKLSMLWQKTIDVKDRENNDSSGDSESRGSLIAELYVILDEAKTILSHADEDRTIKYHVKGYSIRNKIQWLQERIEQLEREITESKSEITNLRVDTKEKMMALVASTDYKKMAEDIIELTALKRKEYEKLREHYAKLFKNGA
jgi:hypothetical protein